MLPLGKNDPAFVASYRLLGVLGGGGMGKVYLGQSRSGKRLAIKVLSEHFAEDAEYRERFAREVAAARLVSPLYTAAVVDSDKDAPSPWLATTYIDGPSLEEWVSRHGKLSSETVLALALGLAEALASIHQAGLVHRDLKPSNIIIDPNGPHIIDFGIALSGDATRITTSMLVGTPSYMAPERINGVDAGPAGDIFSLGATLFYAATGSPLIKDGTFYEQVIQVALGRFELTDVPVKCQPLITRCLSKDPQDRPTAAELVQILVGIGAVQPAHGWWAEREPLPSPLRGGQVAATSRRRLLLTGGAFGLVLLGGGAAAAWSYLSRKPRAQPVLSPTPGPTGTPDIPSRVLWQVASRADRGRPPGPDSLAVRVVIDRGRRVIAASGTNVFATDVLGRPVWTAQMPTASLRLWQWGETLLVASLDRLWLLNAETGQRQAEVDIAALEAPFAARDNPDGMAVQIERILVGPDRAMLTLGPSLVAIDRAGKVSWRLPRPVDSRGRHTAIAVPLFATQTRLVTRESGTTPRIALRQVSDGKVIWRATDIVPPQPQGPGGPGGRDEAWKASEGAIAGQYLVLREGSRLQVRMLDNGRMVWHLTSQTPVAAMERFGDLVLCSADRLFAYRLADGKLAWEQPVRGARLAVTQAGDAVVVANENGVSIRDSRGEPVWQEKFHAAIGDLMPDQVNVDGQAAYVTFRPRDEGPPGGPQGGQSGPKPTESPGAGPPIDAIAYRLGPEQPSATPSPTP